MMVSLAMLLSWIESQLPVFAFVPGMKLGLTNLVVLVTLYKLGEKDAIIINVVRIVLVSITFGNMFSFLYSIVGGMLSVITMLMLKRRESFSMTTVSVVGAITHNVGQIIVAMIVLNTSYIIYYLGILWISGIIAGALIGILGAVIVKRIR